MDRIRTILQSFETLMWEIISYLPLVLIAIALLFFGWLLAKLLKRAFIKVLRWLRVEEVAERVGIDGFLLQGGVRFTLVTLIAEIIYWFLIFILFLLALNVLGMTEAGQMFSRVISYVPKVLIAVVILIFGSLIARFLQAIIFAYLDNIGIRGAYYISTIGQYAILIFVVYVTLEQLSIEERILESALEIGLAGLAFAFGIAFGLGGKDAAKSMLDKALKLDTRDRR